MSLRWSLATTRGGPTRCRPAGAGGVGAFPRLAPWATGCRPAGAGGWGGFLPRLTPWATCCRPAGGYRMVEAPPRLAPWATGCRPAGAGGWGASPTVDTVGYWLSPRWDYLVSPNACKTFARLASLR